MTTNEHQYSITVFYEDTDAAGMVYHANYLKFMERARSTFLRERKLKVSDLVNQYHIQLLVRAANLTFEKPARLEQTLTVVTKVTKLGRASVHFEQKIFTEPHQRDALVCVGEIVIVCTNLKGKPCAIPEPIVRELKSEN